MSTKSLLSIFIAIILCFCLCGCFSDFDENIATNSNVTISQDESSILETDSNISDTENIVESKDEIGILDNDSNVSDTENIVESKDEITTESEDKSSLAKDDHIHSFNNATCTTPKTCICGATEGSENGHSWKDATCTNPKTCTACGNTSGLTAGHNYSNGSCTMCGKEDPDFNHVTMVWIPTNGGTKYHTHAGCSNMENPEQVTQSEAESLGFTPCKRCH